MLKERYDLWQDGEYEYPMAFGFQPNLVSYLHENDEKVRPCIIIVPGGGYRIVSPTEAEIVAKEFYQRGYHTFVCTYTTNITGEVLLRNQPLKDLARAVRYVRWHAAEFGIDEGNVAVCGFSAGGHLCGSLCVHYEDVQEKNQKFAKYSARPDAGILCYPVISSGQYGHRESFCMLYGEKASKEELDYASLEKHVTEQTPPCFLWQTATDELVPVENTYLIAEVFKEKGVRYAQHIFSRGQHGLSLANDIWANGEFGEPYTLEQVFKLVELVKSGLIPSTDEEKNALLEAFDYSEEIVPYKNTPNWEVAVWPELVDTWLGDIFGKTKETKKEEMFDEII